VRGIPTNVKSWSSVSTGSYHTCGIEKDSDKLYCWGGHRYWKACVSGIPTHVKSWSSVSAGEKHTCGIERDSEKLWCWGDDNQKQVSMIPTDVKSWSSVSAADYNTCGIEKETNIPRCWGYDRSRQCKVPVKGVKWTIEPSCQTSHPTVSGPASCTSCDLKGCNREFTIIDPKTNTGTCTKKKCPTCKPKACCGKGHKHYVLNSKNLEGVCVRHSDDCTPVCIPLGNSDDPKVRRVCTKGCNRLLKSLNNIEAKVESEMYNIVTCQADKQVICDPLPGLSVGLSVEDPKYRSSCKVYATFQAKAVCPFSPELWNLGATCITNHVEGETYPQCPDGVSKEIVDSIKSKCREASEEDDEKCSRLGMSY